METKKCTICKLDLPKTDEFFAARTDRKNKYFQSSCRSCHKEYRKIHYQNNKDKYLKKAKIYTSNIFEWFLEIKKKLKCELCGENRHWVLDFHHNDPLLKDEAVGFMARRVASKKKILDEISKCTVLCSNCHRDLHYKETHAA